MAVYRNIHISFWTDTKVTDEFTPEDKYFMLYCLTNEYTNLCGCYEISIKQMSRDLGYSEETIRNLLKRFEEIHKVIFYNENNKELFIKNWFKYNWTKSNKLDKPLLETIKKIKTLEFKGILTDLYNNRDTVSIPYIYPMDTTDTDTDTISNNIINNNIDYNNIINIYNNICTKLSKVSKLTEKRKIAIRKFLKEYTLEDFEKICKIANNSNFLLGKNPNNWKADFDFLLRVDKATSVLEGKYSTDKEITIKDELKQKTEYKAYEGIENLTDEEYWQLQDGKITVQELIEKGKLYYV